MPFSTQVIIGLNLVIVLAFLGLFFWSKSFKDSIILSIKILIDQVKHISTLIPIIIIFVLFCATMIVNLSMPIKDWDSLTLYDFRSRIISLDESITSTAISSSYYLGYPLYTSIGHSLAYTTNVNNPKLWYSLIYLSLGLGFYSVLRRDTKRSFALIGAIALMISPAIHNHAHVAYTNLAYATFFGLGILYHILWLRRGQTSDLVIATYLVTFSAWTRFSEPFWMVFVLMTIVGSIMRRSPVSIVSVVPVYFFRKIWEYFKVSTVISKTINPETSPNVPLLTQLSHMSIADSTNLILSVTRYYYSALILKFPLLIFTAVLGFISIKNKKQLMWNMIYLIMFFGMIYAGTTYFALRVEYWNLIPDSLTRMSYFLIPILYYTILLSLNQILEGRSSISCQNSRS